MYGTVDRIPPRPRWVSLYVLVASMLALFGAVDGFVPAGALRRALEVAVTIIMFGTIHLWVRANRRALELAGARDAGFRTITPDGDAAPSDRPVASPVTDVRHRKPAIRQREGQRRVTALPRR